MSTFLPITISPSLLLDAFSAQLNAEAASQANASATNANSNGASEARANSFGSASSASAQTPPWEIPDTLSAQAEAAKILSITNFIPQNATPLAGTPGASKLQVDNQKLFTLYRAINQLAQLAGIAQQKNLPSGQLAGYNTRFQEGLQQVEAFIGSTKFDNLTLQAQNPSASVTSKVSIPFPPVGYRGGTIVSDANLADALPGVTANDSFTIAVRKGGATTNVNIDLSQIQGTLSLGNIVAYVNQQLSADGFSTRFQRTLTSGSISDIAKASYGITIDSGPGENVALSSAGATPALYLAGTSGSTRSIPTNAATGQQASSPDNQGRLTKLTNVSADPRSTFSANESPSSGTTTAQSTVTDNQGNVYVVGTATGNFGSQLNQGAQDVYLTKYDSAGNLQWSKLLGSAGTAAAYSLAFNASTGGVVISGSTTAALTSTAVSDGNTGSFIVSFDADGNRLWARQIPTLNNNQANAVTADSQGNIYVGGQVTGALGAGQTSSGGTNAYLARLNSSGKIVSEQEFGPSGNDKVAQVATTGDGGVVVASVQNGDAILAKYANGDIATSPVWQLDLGSLAGGSISGVAVSGSQVYVSGTTSNAALDAGGQAAIATASSGNTDAFVFNATDSGTSAIANRVSYVGTGAGATSGGAVVVGPDGTVYLSGTTLGTFAGQTRNTANVDNAFVAALSPLGAIDWARQFGGLDGQSTGKGVAIDPTGSSVLEALGLPRGTINTDQSVDLSANSTLQAGDSFDLQIEGAAGRTATITVQSGDTLRSLADQINSELLSAGKATVTFANGGEALEIAATAGDTLKLIAGPADTDALGRLGIAAGVITAPAKASQDSSTTGSPSFGQSASGANAENSAAKPVFGLGLDSSINLLSGGDAGVARISLQNVQIQITNIYRNLNAPPQNAAAPAQPAGPVPAFLQAQVANYALALASFSAANSLAAASSPGSAISPVQA